MVRAASSLTLAQAQQMIQGAIAYAEQHGYLMSIAVVDAAGTLVAAARMDGARFLTPETARAKAYAAAAYGRSGRELGEAYRDYPPFWASLPSLGRPLLPSQGGVPIVVDDVILGAIGVGGGTSQQDEDTARAGLAAAGFPA
ncbi:MAG: heme-binding protein [Chloroflexi bacterium]|nr:heme-binding protein [Chloroflexota bacterium]